MTSYEKKRFSNNCLIEYNYILFLLKSMYGLGIFFVLKKSMSRKNRLEDPISYWLFNRLGCTLMIKVIFLGQWFGLSNQRLERGISDKIFFVNFLGYPDKVQDSSTIWLFKELLLKRSRIEAVRDERQRQLDLLGLKVEAETIQAATFIKTDPDMLKQISLAGMKRKHQETKMSHGPRREKILLKILIVSKDDMEYGLIRYLKIS